MDQTTDPQPTQGWDAAQIAEQAWRAAQAIDVGDIGYGRVHWGDHRSHKTTPAPYYRFLAGLTASQSIKRVCEIGTHSGGATRAIHRALREPSDSRIVTIDVTRESDKHLSGIQNITKIVGDATTEKTFRRTLNAFADRHKIDLLFIDGGHRYVPELLAFSIYTQALSPRLVVIDDINLNEQMRLLWEKVTASRPAALTLDVATLFPDVRKPSVGFGLIALPENDQIPERRYEIPVTSPWKRRIRNAARSVGWLYPR